MKLYAQFESQDVLVPWNRPLLSSSDDKTSSIERDLNSTTTTTSDDDATHYHAYTQTSDSDSFPSLRFDKTYEYQWHWHWHIEKCLKYIDLTAVNIMCVLLFWKETPMHIVYICHCLWIVERLESGFVWDIVAGHLIQLVPAVHRAAQICQVQMNLVTVLCAEHYKWVPLSWTTFIPIIIHKLPFFSWFQQIFPNFILETCWNKTKSSRMSPVVFARLGNPTWRWKLGVRRWATTTRWTHRWGEFAI